MSLLPSVSATVIPDPTVHATAHVGGPVKAHVKAQGGGAAVPYDGEYTAVPTHEEQVFPTKGRKMRHDFTVEEIHLHQAPNDYGTTITIGG